MEFSSGCGGWCDENAPAALVRGPDGAAARSSWAHRGRLHLMPITMESGPARCSTRISLKPTARIQPAQSAPAQSAPAPAERPRVQRKVEFDDDDLDIPDFLK